MNTNIREIREGMFVVVKGHLECSAPNKKTYEIELLQSNQFNTFLYLLFIYVKRLFAKIKNKVMTYLPVLKLVISLSSEE